MRIQTTISDRVLNAMALFVSTDEARYALNGVRLELEGNQMIYVATDGRIMALYHAEHPDQNWPAVQFILPHPIVNQLVDTEQNCPMEISDADGVLVVKFFLPHGVLECTNDNDGLIDSKYPNWRSVVPTGPICAIPHTTVKLAYLAKFATAAQCLDESYEPILQFRGLDQVVTVQLNGMPEFFGIVMPMRIETKLFPLPEWLSKTIASKPQPVTNQTDAPAQ